jgi:hypothetical protein
MKMKNTVPFLILISYAMDLQAQEKPVKDNSKNYSTITVYTTAEKTGDRLAKTATLTLKPFGQPLEVTSANL